MERMYLMFSAEKDLAILMQAKKSGTRSTQLLVRNYRMPWTSLTSLANDLQTFAR